MLTFNLNKFKGSFLFHRFVTKKATFLLKVNRWCLFHLYKHQIPDTMTKL